MVATNVNIPIPSELVEQVAERAAELVAQRLGAEPEPWVGVEQAARYLDCARSRIYALVHKRVIPHRKDGSRLLFRRSELDRFLEAGGATR